MPILAGLSAHWGWLLARGVAAIVFGVLAFAWPGLTVLTLAVVWGAFALLYGARGAGTRRSICGACTTRIRTAREPPQRARAAAAAVVAPVRPR